MHPQTLSPAAQTLIGYGYWAMFLLMLVEGPVVTAAGAFAAALGVFDIWIVLLLSILGNLIPDAIYYAIGYWGRQQLIDKYGHYFKLTKERVAQLEELAKNHTWKALTLIKLTPVLATPGLIIAGATRLPVKKYAWISLAIAAPTSLFFLIVGYYFGAAYGTISRYFDYGGYILIALIPAFIVVYLIWKKFAEKIAERQ